MTEMHTIYDVDGNPQFTYGPGIKINHTKRKKRNNMKITTAVSVSSEDAANQMVKRARKHCDELYGPNDDFLFQYAVISVAPATVIRVTADSSQIGEAVSFLYK